MGCQAYCKEQQVLWVKGNCLASKSALPVEVDMISLSEISGGKDDLPKF